MESLDQLRAKLPKFVGSFEKFHVALTLEQRAEIVEKMERRRKRTEKGGWGLATWRILALIVNY